MDMPFENRPAMGYPAPVRSTFLSILLAGCGGASVRPAPANHAPTAPESLAAALTREIGDGRSVAIVAGSAGLRALSSDGARQRTLVTGSPAWALIDPRSEVVWFGNDDATQIRAIDLEAAADRPIAVHTVATHVPSGNRVAMVGAPMYDVIYPSQEPGLSGGEAWFSGAHFSTGDSFDMAHARVELIIAPVPSLSGSSGYMQDQDWEAEFKGAAVADQAFLATVLARPDHQTPDLARPAETKVAGVDPGNCEEPGDCGKAEPIAGTHYWRVLVGTATGDIHHVAYQLYDAGAKKLLAPEWATWLDRAWVAPDRSAFVVGGVIVRFDTGPIVATPADQGGLGGGWLGGGTFY